MKFVAYMRVSLRTGMTVENQRPIIERWAELNKETISEWRIEQESTRVMRPIQEQTLQDLKNGKFDGLVCIRIDRWGRSVIELVETINQILESNKRIVFINNGFDLTKENMNATTKLQLNMFSSFAEYERELIRERTREGLERARKEGKILGRPTGSKDKKPRNKSGYWIKYDKIKHPEKYWEQKNVVKNE
jgi:DNA invertase Pin-like site-specific DNA recombinase